MSAQALDAPRGFVTKAEHYKALRKIDELEAELAELRAKVVEEAKAATLMRIGRVLKIPRSTACLLHFLNTGTVRTEGSIVAAVLMPNAENPIPTLRTYMCWLRAAIKRAGGPADAIHCMRGVGYTLTPEARQWLQVRVYGPSENGGET